MHVLSALFLMLTLAACSERERARVELQQQLPDQRTMPEEPRVPARVPASAQRTSETETPSPLPSNPPASTSSPSEIAGRPAEALDEVMAGFLTALTQKDVERFLVYFSRSKPFRYIGTIEVKRRVTLVDYEDLARGLRARDVDRGWYSILFDGGPDDSLAQTVADPDARAWRLVGEHKFVPPEDDADSTLFVIWRKERDRWVVDAIGYPGA